MKYKITQKYPNGKIYLNYQDEYNSKEDAYIGVRSICAVTALIEGEFKISKKTKGDKTIFLLYNEKKSLYRLEIKAIDKETSK